MKSESVVHASFTQGCSVPPKPVRFVLVGKQGQPLITASSASSLMISYTDQGQQITVPYVLGAIKSTGTIKGNYGGVGIGSDLGSYSIRETNPVKQFQLTLNGQEVGVLTYNLQRTDWTQGCYRQVEFLFNGRAVTMDETVMPFVAVLQTAL